MSWRSASPLPWSPPAAVARSRRVATLSACCGRRPSSASSRRTSRCAPPPLTGSPRSAAHCPLRTLDGRGMGATEPTMYIVQLPFPSTYEPDPDLAAYYRTYDRRFRELLPEYWVPEGELWEIPLWVAHLTALLDEVELRSEFVDLSGEVADAHVCASRLLDATEPGDLVLVSPLAQNFALALDV